MTDETTNEPTDAPRPPEGIRIKVKGGSIPVTELEYLGVDPTGTHHWTAVVQVESFHIDLLPGNTSVGFEFRAPVGLVDL
jgi:hypothetical protein